MGKEELKSSIAELRKELAKLSEGDKHINQKIESLINDIEKKISEEGVEANPSITGTIKSHIREVEAEHPRLTEALNNIATLLSSMGI